MRRGTSPGGCLRRSSPSGCSATPSPNASSTSCTRLVCRAAQLNGHESPADVAYVAEKVPLVIKAFAPNAAALTDISEYHADAILVEAPAPGPGKIFDWRLAERMPRSHRLILGGGLDPGNVADAIQRLRPWGVDVSTGVETGARKDPRKVRAFIQEARAALPEEENRAPTPPTTGKRSCERPRADSVRAERTSR